MLKLPETDTHFRNLKKVNGYQRSALFHALAFVKQWNVAVDIGAHVGYITKDIAPLFQEVHSFEPEPDNFLCLCENKPANVMAHKVALGYNFGRGNMWTPYAQNSGAWQFQKTDGSGLIGLMPLDEFKLAPDFIKVDVQGMELDVLKGAEKTITQHHPVLLVETMMDGVESKAIFDWLKDRDYDFSLKVGKNTVFVWKQMSRVGI